MESDIKRRLESMAKILIAASPEPRAILERVLRGHELHSASTMTEAEQLLHVHTDFDQIICTVLFEESRMFDFLRTVQSKRKWRQIPFVCARIRPTSIDIPIAVEGVAIASRALGAVDFLNATDYKDDPDKQLREALEKLLPRNDFN